MAFWEDFRGAHGERAGELAGAREALEALALASPLYGEVLLREPEVASWVAEGEIHLPRFGPGRLERVWAELHGASEDEEDLRCFRRRMTLRIAYREVNGLAPMAETLLELSHVADFCLRRVFGWTRARWEARLGVPTREEDGEPARLSVMGLGKLGGQELNFCSDVDLIYLYEGVGYCHRQGRATGMDNLSFFTRVCQEATAILQKRTAAGFLYNVDLRLRPEGDAGQLVLPLSAATAYYFTRGQTWERLMLLKARAVAGEAGVTEELLEQVHTFRYPRHPPPSLPQDVAQMKRRTELEVLDQDRRARNIKSGPGGIRDIEFFAQLLVLVHAAQYPFLQTGSTREALRQLERYKLITAEARAFLEETYDGYRRIENRLQMRDEKQTHELPSEEGTRADLARSLGFGTWGAFAGWLAERRQRVRGFYDQLFPEHEGAGEVEAWTAFFGGEVRAAAVEGQLRRWFGDVEAGAKVIRHLILGDRHHHIRREEVTLFLDLAAKFDGVYGQLADPLVALRRLDAFATRYGARTQFLKACHENPRLLEVLALLFDRSGAIAEVLNQHPEILDELLNTPPRLRKERAQMVREMEQGPAGAGFAGWLWLYVRAEQVRISLNTFLARLSLREVEDQLTSLVEAAMETALVRAGGMGLAVVAFGKAGAAEMTLGSDLDLMVLARDAAGEADLERLRNFLQLISHPHPLGKTYEVDLRLRPHGPDGPPLVTLGALDRYHREGSAQAWERQLLTRARAVAGDRELARHFEAWRRDLLFREPISREEEAAMAAMRERVVREKVRARPPELDFKACEGGLADVEYLAQHFQLRYGWREEGLRGQNTRRLLAQVEALALLPAGEAAGLREHYEYLRMVEFVLRRDTFAADVTLDGVDLERVAVWMGFSPAGGFLEAHVERVRAAAKVIEAGRGESDSTRSLT